MLLPLLLALRDGGRWRNEFGGVELNVVRGIGGGCVLGRLGDIATRPPTDSASPVAPAAPFGFVLMKGEGARERERELGRVLRDQLPWREDGAVEDGRDPGPPGGGPNMLEPLAPGKVPNVEEVGLCM